MVNYKDIDSDHDNLKWYQKINVPVWPWYKWLIFMIYVFFAIVYLYAMLSGFLGLFRPVKQWFNEKFNEPRIYGGKSADLVYITPSIEYIGDELSMHQYGPITMLQSGEAFKECRLFCIDHPDCVFFSVFSDEYFNTHQDKVITQCFLKGAATNEKRITNKYDSGVLLNRIPAEHQINFNALTPQSISSAVYIDHQQAKELYHQADIHLNVNHVNVNNPINNYYFYQLKGYTKAYFLQYFMGEKVESLIKCWQKEEQNTHDEFIYKRSNKLCFKKLKLSKLTNINKSSSSSNEEEKNKKIHINPLKESKDHEL